MNIRTFTFDYGLRICSFRGSISVASKRLGILDILNQPVAGLSAVFSFAVEFATHISKVVNKVLFFFSQMEPVKYLRTLFTSDSIRSYSDRRLHLASGCCNLICGLFVTDSENMFSPIHAPISHRVNSTLTMSKAFERSRATTIAPIVNITLHCMRL